jgi:hypothetical protein
LQPAAVSRHPGRQRRPSRRFGAIDFQPCTLSTEGASANVEAQCATLQVPEDRAHPAAARSACASPGWNRAAAEPASLDPVFFLAGGPGQAASEVAVIVDTALRQVRKQRDVFLIDQRGTGGSNPLSCLGADGKELQMDEDAAPTEASLRDYAQRCAASLQGRADARFYTTTEAIADLDAVRQALGVDRSTWSVVPTARAWPSAMPAPIRSTPAASSSMAWCPTNWWSAASSPARSTMRSPCSRRSAARMPSAASASRSIPAQQLRAVAETLRRAPVSVEYRDPGTNAPRQDVLTPDSVVGLAFAFSYVPQYSSLLPLVLDEAAQGRYAPLASLVRGANRSMDFQINRGMQWSVICSEDAPRFQAPAEDR